MTEQNIHHSDDDDDDLDVMHFASSDKCYRKTNSMFLNYGD